VRYNIPVWSQDHTSPV